MHFVSSPTSLQQYNSLAAKVGIYETFAHLKRHLEWNALLAMMESASECTFSLKINFFAVILWYSERVLGTGFKLHCVDKKQIHCKTMNHKTILTTTSLLDKFIILYIPVHVYTFKTTTLTRKAMRFASSVFRSALFSLYGIERTQRSTLM